MNIHNMTIFQDGRNMLVEYDCGPIVKAFTNCDKKTIMFYYFDRPPVAVDVSVVSEISFAYNSQFGITLTDDGTLFFIQNWETGLYCFETATGNLKWHHKRKHAFETATKGNLVFCRFLDECLCVIDTNTGCISKRYPMGYGTILEVLSDDYFLSGPKRNKYELLDWNLQIIERIPSKVLNPKELESFIIQKALLTGNIITISGVEYSDRLHRNPHSSGSLGNFPESGYFKRTIQLNALDSNGAERIITRNSTP